MQSQNQERSTKKMEHFVQKLHVTFDAIHARASLPLSSTQLLCCILLRLYDPIDTTIFLFKSVSDFVARDAL